METVKQLSELDSRFAPEPRSRHHAAILEYIRSTGALLRGHFALQSGAHSDHFVRFAQLGRDRAAIAFVARELHEVLAPPSPIDAIIAPESAGFFLGNALATLLKVPLSVSAIDWQRHPTGRLRTGTITAGSKVLVVNDVVTTGRSLHTLLSCVRDQGAKVAGVAVFAALDASAFAKFLYDERLPGAYLVAAKWTPTPPAECQPCARQEPLMPAGEFN